MGSLSRSKQVLERPEHSILFLSNFSLCHILLLALMFFLISEFNSLYWVHAHLFIHSSGGIRNPWPLSLTMIIVENHSSPLLFFFPHRRILIGLSLPLLFLLFNHTDFKTFGDIIWKPNIQETLALKYLKLTKSIIYINKLLWTFKITFDNQGMFNY